MQSEHNKEKKTHEDHAHTTMITINLDGNDMKIQKGTYRVSDLKAQLGVPADYEFDLVEKGGEFRPLDDSAILEVEKHMKFISHVRCGASS